LAVVLVFFARQAKQTIGLVRQTWQPVSWAYLILALGLFISCYFILAFAWYGLLRTLGGHISFRSALKIYGLTLLPRYVPGTVWGYAGRTLLCEQAGVARRIATLSVLVEVGLIVSAGGAVSAMRWLQAWWVAVVGGIGVLLLLGTVWARSIRWNYASRIHKLLVWYGWVLVYIGFWLVYGGASCVIVCSISPMMEPSIVANVIVSATVAWLAGFAVLFVPSGLGIREGVWALALTPIVGPAGSVFVPLVARGMNMLAELLFAALTFLIRYGASLINRFPVHDL